MTLAPDRLQRTPYQKGFMAFKNVLQLDLLFTVFIIINHKVECPRRNKSPRFETNQIWSEILVPGYLIN
jgi:hypothetical protein